MDDGDGWTKRLTDNIEHQSLLLMVHLTTGLLEQGTISVWWSSFDKDDYSEESFKEVVEQENRIDEGVI